MLSVDVGLNVSDVFAGVFGKVASVVSLVGTASDVQKEFLTGVCF